MRQWLAPQLPGFHMVTWDHRATGDTVTLTRIVRADVLRQVGLSEAMEVHAEVVVRDGKIASFTRTDSPQTTTKLQALQRGRRSWLQAFSRAG